MFFLIHHVLSIISGGLFIYWFVLQPFFSLFFVISMYVDEYQISLVTLLISRPIKLQHEYSIIIKHIEICMNKMENG